MRAMVTLLLLLTLSACAAKTVRCDGRLSPINAPAPVAGSLEASKSSRGAQ